MNLNLKHLLSVIPTIVVFNCCQLEFDTNQTAYDIIIIAGQSNTHQGEGLNFSLDKSDINIFQLGRISLYDHVIIKAEEPLQHHTCHDNKIGFGLTFSKFYNNKQNRQNRPILIIPCGYGGSTIEEWNKNGFLYEDLIERVSFIKEKYPQSTIKAILWHQGESNIGTPNYSEQLDQFIYQIRQDLNDNTPFILGGMVPYYVSFSYAREQQQYIIKDTPNRVPNTAYADPNTPFVIEKNNNEVDAIHFDAKGQRELGKRYYSAYTELLK